MARIECYISPTNDVRRRVGVTYTPKGFNFHKSEGKWDYAFSIAHRDVMCVDYSPNEFPASYKKAAENFIRELEKSYKLTKRVKHVKLGLSSSGSMSVGSSSLKLEIFVVE